MNQQTAEHRRMPTVFVGHGSPMIAVERNSLTEGLKAAGEKILAEYGSPRAILAISAHWYVRGNKVQYEEHPEQVYDMYGFPKRLYDVKYAPQGYAPLSEAVLAIKDLHAEVDNTWGIDHGTWTPLVHMFPGAEIPIVQLSVSTTAGPEDAYAIGKKLARLRDEGYLILGSGNTVHNLAKVNWRNPGGTEDAISFDNYILDCIQRRDDAAVIHYDSRPEAGYAVPTPEHFLPQLYILGASEGEKPYVFNHECNLGAIAMTSYLFG